MTQTMIYDETKREVRTVIKKPFIMASEMLGWKNRKSQGLGFNKNIINTCLSNHANLTVYVESNDCWYTISYESLKSFLDYYFTDYQVKSNVVLNVIAFEEFHIVDDNKND